MAESLNVVVDIGGSGTRLGIVKNARVTSIRRENVGSISDLANAIRQLTDDYVPDAVALAVPGSVENNNVVFSRLADWLVGNTADSLGRELRMNPKSIYVVHDGEAHAMALHHYPKARFGAINLAIGTSVALGVLDAGGHVLRSLSGDNWEIGDFELKTRSAEKRVWYVLGSRGFEELRQRDEREGINHYGWRLGAFVAQMSLIFRPKTVGLSGGIIRQYWDLMEAGFYEEFARLLKFEQILSLPNVIVLADDYPALTGLSILLGVGGVEIG